jgi:hypothetical protein
MDGSIFTKREPLRGFTGTNPNCTPRYARGTFTHLQTPTPDASTWIFDLRSASRLESYIRQSRTRPTKLKWRVGIRTFAHLLIDLHGFSLDPFFIILSFKDPVHIDARNMHMVRVKFPGFNKMLHFRYCYISSLCH